MQCPETVPCNLCGFPAQVVCYSRLERGRRVLKPVLVESDDGQYLFIDCPVHGRRAQPVVSAARLETNIMPTDDGDGWTPPRKPK
jgi:hypothetical protein